MFKDRIEHRWIETFVTALGYCKVEAGEEVAILSETQSRELNVHLTELALLRLGARPFHVVMPTPPQSAPVPVRSTGASNVVQGLGPVVKALSECTMVVDLTVEGMLHAPELPGIIENGARLFMVSNEHPDALERLLPDPALTEKVKAAVKKIRGAKEMTVHFRCRHRSPGSPSRDRRAPGCGAIATGPRPSPTGRAASSSPSRRRIR